MGRTKTKTADQPTLIVDNAGANVPAVQETKELAVAQPDPIFTIIERLAKDPSFDVDKMERLINMHERAKAGNARAEYDVAMAAAQLEMKTVRTNSKNSQTNSKYASYAALDKAIRPIYAKHGFSVSFGTAEGAPADHIRVVATVAHSGGHREQPRLDMPADGKGAKGGDVMTKTHATGSAMTYGQRYLMRMIFNLSVGDDDDGNAAGDRAKAWTDSAITHLNVATLDKDALAKWYSENEKAINWLKKSAPEEYARYQVAYSNAAERAGIAKEEPRRSGTAATSTAPTTAPPTQSVGDGQPEATAGEGTAPSGRSEENVTDVHDENAPLEFEVFKTARAFFEFSDGWLQDPKRTPAEAVQWEKFYHDKLAEMAKHEYQRIREATAEVIGFYSAVLAKK